ncbi:hypothetical protein B5V88_13400 [Heyndrickxia sporothermodurans]|nr:hypothetical protein B5V88_13400 [Heyndrickxia sporothermodurans]
MAIYSCFLNVSKMCQSGLLSLLVYTTERLIVSFFEREKLKNHDWEIKYFKRAGLVTKHKRLRKKFFDTSQTLGK